MDQMILFVPNSTQKMTGPSIPSARLKYIYPVELTESPMWPLTSACYENCAWQLKDCPWLDPVHLAYSHVLYECAKPRCTVASFSHVAMAKN